MPGSISGQVVDTNGKGIEKAKVSVNDVAGAASAEVLTDANGKYAIPNLAPGKYVINVQATGFKSPGGMEVEVKEGQDTPRINFKLEAAPTAQTGSIAGRVTNEKGIPVAQAGVEVVDAQDQIVGSTKTDTSGDYAITNLPAGIYTVRVQGNQYLAARNVAVISGIKTEGIDFSLNVVKDFLDRLDDARFSIESPISIEEANQAVSLFSVVNLLLAGMSQRRVGNEDKTDVLGVLNLYYGLQEGSLEQRLPVADPRILWSKVEVELKDLAKDLDQLQSDVDFLNREAKRQFNLGTSNNVLGNVQFPGLFKRYVEIGTDPLLSIDIRKEEQNGFFDKTKIAQADDLLKELKALLLQIVRSLSKYGTAATKRVNEDWATFEARALEVLITVARERVSKDEDDKNPWAVLAVLTQRNRETQVAPYVVLGRHGGKLLRYAMDIYLETQDQLDNFDRNHLRDLFQRPGQIFWTDRIRREADVIKRYPLPNWG